MGDEKIHKERSKRDFSIRVSPETKGVLEMNLYRNFTIRLIAFVSMFGFILVDTTPLTAQETLTKVNTTKYNSANKLRPHPFLMLLSDSYKPKNAFWQNLFKGSDRNQGSIAGSIWGGLLGGTVGFCGGLFLGAITCPDCGFDAIGRSLAGATIGEVLVLPLGVHYGNRRQGNLGLDLLTSVMVVGTGALLMNRLNADESLFIVLPVLQIGVTVTVERYTAKP